MENERRKTGVLLWYAAIFAFMFVWFTTIHPLAVFDGDDWTYISFARKAVPTLKEWNPAKILPEILMPFCGSIAVHVVAPLLGDYILSFSVVSAIAVSFFITFYIYCLGTLVKRLFDLPDFECRCTELLFLILHFMVFVHDRQNNEYLFYCRDLTCYYNYLIPALINTSIVMLMAGNSNGVTDKGDYVKQSLWILIVYFG